MSLKSESNDELFLRRKIEQYYLPNQLVDAIVELGEIPESSEQTQIGIAFLDIADYTFLSKFLSPKENHIFLNGLYAAFSWVIKRHGGYLNKIEGDSIMFHYGGPIDPESKDKEHKENLNYIARELFYTCVELQRFCNLFNTANESVMNLIVETEAKKQVHAAYEIISALRNNYELSSAMNALFQVRIRVGASLGEVLIGNFGPEGSRQWDVIGLPVIDAKRMESSAPVGGLRISNSYYKILKDTGVLKNYFSRFKRESLALQSSFRDIEFDEVFKCTSVFISGKKVSEYKTYSVQVNPSLPEDISKQASFLMSKGEYGADRIIDLFKYYRGNSYVIHSLEDLLKKLNINLRKGEIFSLLQQNKYQNILENNDNSIEKTDLEISKKYSLFDLFSILGKIQDKVKRKEIKEQNSENQFLNYKQYLDIEKKKSMSWLESNKSSTFKTYYFHHITYPLLFSHIKASILEYQVSLELVEEI